MHVLRTSGHDVEDLGDVPCRPDPARDPVSHVVNPRGLSALIREVDLAALARTALGRRTCAGWDAGTYNPDRDPDGTYATRIVGFIAEALHARDPR